jgi:hypothetical protein
VAEEENVAPAEAIGLDTGLARLFAFWEGGRASYALGPRGVVRVGRAAGCELQVDHPSVSRVHARLIGGIVPTIRDLGSANGVRIGGVPIRVGEDVPLAPGEVIELGDVVLVVKGGTPRREQTRPPSGLTGPMEAFERLVAHVAASDLGVLVVGEPGVGKGVTARAIHARSRRAARPFVVIDCARPEAEVERELFGLAEDADVIAAADGGSIFFDEVLAASLATQEKVVAWLERARAAGVRLIASTSRDAEERVRARAFLRELYLALNGVTLAVPPLRVRRGEPIKLAEAFLAAACARASRATPRLAPEVVAWLATYDFPGNVRELEGYMERAATTAHGPVVALEHLGVGAG